MITKIRLIKTFLLTVLILFGVKIYQYASEPKKQKLCTFVYPNLDDASPSTVIQIYKKATNFSWLQKGGFINDASCLNQTAIYGVVDVQSESDIQNALAFAKQHHLKVSLAGQQHSMGGQSFVKNGLVLNMKSFRKMKIDEQKQILNVQSGALWSDVQNYLDPKGFSVKSMQSINIFTVGGTLSVNAHGVDHNPGHIAPTVQSLRVMLSDGQILKANLQENEELFRSVIGGYGLMGVILDVNLKVVKNEVYSWKRDFINYQNFSDYYKKSIANNSNIGLFYARLSISPNSYLKEVITHKYEKVEQPKELPVLVFLKHTWLQRLVINFSKTGKLGRWTRWFLEKNMEPNFHICSRNEAMSQPEVCLVSRNQEMYDSMGYLKNKLKDTDILQEYFIPHDKMPEFIDGLRETVQKNNANLLNVTIRIVKKDTITKLPYAKQDMFAFVLYFNQKFDQKNAKALQKTTIDLIDLAIDCEGTYYLPYQLYYSKNQLLKAYPEVSEFFLLKKKYDEADLFSNKFYQKYSL